MPTPSVTVRFEVDPEEAMRRGFGLVDSIKILSVVPEVLEAREPGLWKLIAKRMRGDDVMREEWGETRWNNPDGVAPDTVSKQPVCGTHHVITAPGPNLDSLIEAVLADEARMDAEAAQNK